MRRDYYDAMRSAGYEDLHGENPKVDIQHFLGKLKPYVLYRRMLEIVKQKKTRGSAGKSLADLLRSQLYMQKYIWYGTGLHQAH